MTCSNNHRAEIEIAFKHFLLKISCFLSIKISHSLRFILHIRSNNSRVRIDTQNILLSLQIISLRINKTIMIILDRSGKIQILSFGTSLSRQLHNLSFGYNIGIIIMRNIEDIIIFLTFSKIIDIC